MHRSRTQIATSYAPGALFTYEGGMGCCEAIPVSRPTEQIKPAIKKQMFERMEELIESWFQRAMNCRNAEGPQVLPQQCLEDCFLNHQHQPQVQPNKFELTQPSAMGFAPSPLVFVCSRCGLLHEFKDAGDLKQRWPHVSERTDCVDGQAHRWRQMDVIYAHWSGNYEGLSPYRYHRKQDGEVSKISHCGDCGSEEFMLVTNRSPFFNDWRFQCTTCGTSKELIQPDPFTLRELGGRPSAEGHQPKEWNMLPVSYRASSTHYVQSDNFIALEDDEVSGLLLPARMQDLGMRLMKLHGYTGGAPAATDAEIIGRLKAAGHHAEAQAMDELRDLLDTQPAGQARDYIERSAREKRQSIFDRGLIADNATIPAGLHRQLAQHSDWARRYNPIRLTLEHDAIRKHVVDQKGSGRDQPAIDLTDPASTDIDPADKPARDKYISRTSERIRRLGFAEAAFVRKLDVVEFSFGYTRVSSTPVTQQKRLSMPVRLKAFAPVTEGKRPIYAMQQKNEAFYIRLDPKLVREWLEANHLGADLPTGNDKGLGGGYIETYHDFGRFLDDFNDQARDRQTPRRLPNYVYGLLHTMAHHFTHVLSEFSGLDHGSLGEYIFPADLAFIVYRRGMTPDLGNLSATWRNRHDEILYQLLDRRALLCGSGSLCDRRGGACPACVMLPEVTCIANNRLLSRSMLVGGPAPQWDADDRALTGYLDLASARASATGGTAA